MAPKAIGPLVVGFIPVFSYVCAARFILETKTVIKSKNNPLSRVATGRNSPVDRIDSVVFENNNKQRTNSTPGFPGCS